MPSGACSLAFINALTEEYSPEKPTFIATNRQSTIKFRGRAQKRDKI
jgi:hypothetical protein